MMSRLVTTKRIDRDLKNNFPKNKSPDDTVRAFCFSSELNQNFKVLTPVDVPNKHTCAF
jgi:hypothetical protein